ncbi:MAG: WecB/TagA/CpsF family glycosyltransferase [Chloroflexota bacterium]
MKPRFLLVQLADIGDLVLATPAIAALREAYPDTQIDLLTSTHAAPIVENTGLVDGLHTLDRTAVSGTRALLKPRNLRHIFALRHSQYDAVIFFHHFTLRAGTLKFWLIARASGAKQRIGLDNGNGWFLTDRVPDYGFGAKHQAQYWLDLVSVVGADPTPRPARIQFDDPPPAFHLGSTQGPTVAVHAGSGGYSMARRWEPQRFAAVADRLAESHNARIIVVGSSGDDSATLLASLRSPALDLTGQTTLPQLAGVLRHCDLFIGADSGVMHVAAASGAPVVGIFGPSNHEAWGPWSPGGSTAIVRSNPACSPCSYVDHGIGLRDGCRARTCMHMVTETHVYRAADQLLSGDEIQRRQTLIAETPDNSSKPWQRIHVLGLPIDGMTYSQLLDQIAQWIDTGNRTHHICTTNPEFMMIARSDPNFRHILRRADLCVPDGVGLLWAARHQGTSLPGRVTGSDSVPIIAEHAARRGWRLYLLGAAPGIAEKAGHILQEQYPGLKIAGTYSGSPAAEEEDAIVERINKADADILFVAYGAPVQDKWIARNLPRLQVSMAMGVGGAFDFIAGVVPRAPLWMRRLGVEWLYRLLRQPWRFKRMLRLPRFVAAVLLSGDKTPGTP